MKLIIKLLLPLLLFSVSGCSNLKNNDRLPDKKPKDFNFVFYYGIDGKNKLDTAEGLFTKDMISAPAITVELKLSDEEMNSIYGQMKKINIISYPEDFKPSGQKAQDSFDNYIVKITYDGIEKYINWKDDSGAQNKDAVQLRELFDNIKAIIMSKEEYKELPEPSGAYA